MRIAAPRDRPAPVKPGQAHGRRGLRVLGVGLLGFAVLVITWWFVSPAPATVWYGCKYQVWTISERPGQDWATGRTMYQVAGTDSPLACSPRRCPADSAAITLGIGASRETDIAEFDGDVRRLPFGLVVLTFNGEVRVVRGYWGAGYCMVE
jgi:hypothetical protein